ncbi:reverse transcriptase [Caerostris darwini]|uniref:Reverse transcriptase n=1 Tax=Caerostris darwini TaxID=1538125 RepID=A0AAV4P674_9ARAC|nr:reverse transcriptase [Caerostris darwini]
MSERHKSLYDQYKCKRCLKKGHKKPHSKAKWVKCKLCNSQSHLECLCYSHSVGPPESKNNKNEVASETNVSLLFPGNPSKDIPKQTIYYQTLRAQIVNNNCEYNVRIICDSASERSYICESIAERAGLKTVGKEKLKIFTFASNEASVSELKRKRITLKNCNSDLVITLEALATKTICASKISSPSSRMVELLQNEGFQLSDSGASSGRVDILIGNDYLSAILTGRTHPLNNCLMLYESVFGWTDESEENLLEGIRAMWEIENLGICDSEKSESDKEVIERFEKNLKFVDNRYETGLLWKRDAGDLSDNFDLARRQFNKVRKELKNDIFVKGQLMEVIKYQKEHNIIQECGENEKGYFMPFRAVVHKDKLSTQVRMVFNCSSCAKGNASLNDCLDQGPNLNPSVLDIILGFRKFKIGFCGDIEKAFLMIGIAEDDKKYLKFLWYPDDDNEDFKIMQMNRVVFGCNCSPFLLSATIKYHIGKYSETNKSCFEMLNGSLYADDLCHGADDIESAFNQSSDAVSILIDASFNLRKLHTNSKQLHDLWIQNGLCDENSFEKDNKLKVLGLVWNLEEDMLRVDVRSLLESFKFLENTKRSVLSTAAKVFDPIGFLSAVCCAN